MQSADALRPIDWDRKGAMLLSPIPPHSAVPLYAAMHYHLPVQAVLAGDAEGTAYGDDPHAPRAALLACGHRLYAGGSAATPGAAEALAQCLQEVVMPRGQAEGREAFSLAYLPEDWGTALSEALAPLLPLRELRQCFTFVGRRSERPLPPPAGFTLREADAALLNEPGLLHLEALREEMCSERPSVDEFLTRSFGLCALHGREVAGWCLSEYNSGARCEVGIGVGEPFQRRGLGASLAEAFIELAQARGIADIGWHCRADNAASVATARRAGYELVCDYPVYLLLCAPVRRLAAQGHQALQAGRYAQALAWHERALAQADAPAWVAYEAACACARLARAEEAFAYLSRAVQGGFTHLSLLRACEHLQPLHRRPEWQALLAELGAGDG